MSFNRSRIRTVVCVTVTSNLRLADAPGNVAISQGEGGLRSDSVANVSQVVTLDEDDLVERLGRVQRTTMRRVRAGLRQVLDLT